MVLRFLPAAALVAAGVMLAGCQTTGTGKTTTFVSEERQACFDLGFTPGTEEFEACVDQIERDVNIFRTQLENEFGGHIDVVVECDVEVDVEAFSYRVVCSRAAA